MDRRHFLVTSALGAAGVILPENHFGGAAAPAPRPISPGDAVARACKDVENLNPKDACFTRYLFTPDPSELWRRVWKLHMNLLSRYSESVDVVAVEPWLWRLDLRDPQWDPVIWENIGKNDPYFHIVTKLKLDTVFKVVWPGGFSKGKFFRKKVYEEHRKAGDNVVVGAPWLPTEQLNDLRLSTFSESPVVLADWLFVQSARQRNLLDDDNHGIGYYDFLQLKDRNDFFELVKFNVRDSEKFGREWRAAIEKSNVTPQNRQIFVGKALGGNIWGTLDTDKQKKRGIALDNLGPGEFDHNTEEWYGFLPNGLPAMFLSDDKGVRQNVAPGDTHGLHDSSPLNESISKTLHINLSCIQCHEREILKDFRDDIRTQFKKGQYLLFASVNRHQDLLFRKLYFSDIYKELKQDQLKYQEAFTLHTRLNSDDPKDKGLTPLEAVKAYSRQFHKYATDDVTLSKAAMYVGVTQGEFVASIRHFAKPLDLPTLVKQNSIVRYIRKEPLNLTVLTFEDRYQQFQDIYAAWSAAIRKGKINIRE